MLVGSRWYTNVSCQASQVIKVVELLVFEGLWHPRSLQDLPGSRVSEVCFWYEGDELDVVVDRLPHLLVEGVSEPFAAGEMVGLGIRCSCRDLEGSMR